ncbi:uncharacterized protein LOC142978677 [Anticarsia gemmatalis]|uniref:uncharacterized protein LOC142978677 n=1 Tax=Anticarsia gemmatalis TaxID=129554 RepID=UPI003F76254B
MKDTALLLLCAAALALGSDITASKTARDCNCDPAEAQKICEANYDKDNVLIAHEFCDKFYKCSNGKPYVYDCPANLLYDPVQEKCEWPHLVECGDRPISDGDSPVTSDPDCDGDGDSDTDNGPTQPPVDDGGDDGGNDNGDNDNGGNDNDGNDNGTCNCNPGEAPSICAKPDSDGVLVAHENCNQFYKCDHGKPVVFTCPPNTLYNPYKEECDWPENVDCGDRVVPEPDDNDNGDNDNGGNDSGDNDNGNGDNEDSGNGDNDNDGGDNGTCNCNPEEAPAICAADDSDGTLVAHENCNQFYKCDHGKPVVFTCPPNTLYNPYKEQCDWPENVDCGDRLIPDPDDNDNGDNDNGENDNDNGDNDNGNGDNDNGNGDNDNGNGDNDDNGNGDNDNDGGDNGTCNCNPEEAPAICAADDSDGTLVAHENCNQFYKCAHGKPVVFTCPPNTLYNPYKEQCDWPENVDCGDRLIPDPDDNDNDNGDHDNGGNDNDNGNGDNDDNGNGDNGNGDNDNDGGDNGTCNCNPEEAPAICAADDSDGTLVAHENCNQFYKCAHGKPVVFTCPPNTLYNPYKEQCDWPENVDCGDRLIPDPDDNDNDNGDHDNGGNDNDNGNGDNDDNGNGDNDDNGNGDNDNDGGDNGTCNCNPEEAPAICAADDSDGTLVAHENCNQFYKCAHGKPVVFTCPPNTLYNPYKEQCDWPENVDCGDRLIPDPDDNDNDNGNGDNDDNGNGDNDDNGNGDNDDNGNGDNDGGDNGTCNCNPEEAPAICAADDSDGTLVAHENCNQFYKCAHGKPVVFTCPPNTLYNPYKEQCDWAENVDCGDRLIPDPNDNDNGGNDNDNGNGDNDDNDNGDNDDNDDNDNGDNDDNGNGDNDGGDNGTCNCNPEEAPAICAADDSDGTLVAHENCNQFYKCAHGKPVVFTCPPNTLYNPYKEQCDWSENVDCGDRLIPDPGDNDNDNGGNDNDNGNGDNDDNGNGNEDDNSSDDSDIDDNLPNDPENDDTCNCNPDEAASICAGENSNGILIAHQNCNQFYQCSYGRPVVFTCPPNTLYNPYKEECDWASSVDCGDRVIPEPDNDDNSSNDSDDNDSPNDPDNDGTCNCNPEEAPTICAGADSDGILIAHENCNQFYMCSNGSPVPITCPPDTLYNPYKEQCDWASNVECGDRVIPESEEDDGGNDNDSDNDNDDGDNDNNIINDDPSQAPAICAEYGSNGVFVAHENCDQFYQCSGGVPIPMNCSGGLLYNPLIQQCDWPRNVDCGDRNRPDDDCACNPRNAPALCSRDNSDGKLIAHENCNQFYVCMGGVPLPRFCAATLFYNIDKETCDWPVNVDCSNRYVLSYSSLNKHLESRQSRQ